MLSISPGTSFCPLDSTISPDSMWASPVGYTGDPGHGEFNARTPWEDFDPTEEGFQITYSYSNFLDGALPGGVLAEDLIRATEEALGLWASVAPLHFIEIVDSGPIPEDVSYDAANHPMLRIGHHLIDGPSSVLAHAYFPHPNGLGGDVHFDSGDTWTIGPGVGFDVIEVMLHELGHSLGLGHELVIDAIMNPFYGERFDGFDTGFLLDDDIAGIQFLYGEGEGSVTPLQPLLVDTLTDEDDGNIEEGDFSLREAIKASLAAGGKQKVSFKEDLTGTILLDPNLGSLVINGNVIIEGLGPGVITVQATDPSSALGDGFSIFTIVPFEPEDPEEPIVFPDVEISGLTLTGADSTEAGGAISSKGNSLTLTDVKIHGNHSEAEGGGIYSEGKLTITGSSIENNTSGSTGGGVHASGGITLDSSTVAGNTSEGNGGGISAVGDGTSIVITSSTLSGNTAVGNSGGGLSVYDSNPARLRVLYSTVFDNTADDAGGGIYMYNGVLVLEHTIVAGNHSAISPDIDNVNLFADPVVLAKSSLIGIDNTQSTITQLAPNLVGTPGAAIDPDLGPLLDNGGPTKTHKPNSTSPVIDAGNPLVLFAPEFDQRGEGFNRIISNVIDIGAFEYAGDDEDPDGDIVTSLVDEIDFTDDEMTLREAIQRANTNPGFDRISFAPSLNGGTIQLNSALGQLLITERGEIDASSLTAGITISAETTDPSPFVNNGSGTRILRIDDANAAQQFNFTLEGITFKGGDVTGDGGAIYSFENLVLVNVSLLDNYATGNGGGLYHRDGTLEIRDSTIALNGAGGDGGGLWNNTSLPDPEGEEERPTSLLINSTVSTNTAGDEGGGIFNFDGLLIVRHATVTSNTALKGGGVVSFGDPATKTQVYSSIIAGNTGLDVERSRSTTMNTFESLGYNIVGLGNAILKFNNHDTREVLDPQLGPLSFNGGKTMTHEPLAGSLVIDAGDPEFDTEDPDGDPETNGTLRFDQRGDGFDRLVDGNQDDTARIDVGAVEVQPAEPDADFDGDGDVDGRDFLAWQRGVGKTNPTLADGDADGDGAVDGTDLSVWQDTYGTIKPAGESAPVALAAPSESDNRIDSAVAPAQQVAAKSTVGPLLPQGPQTTKREGVALEDRELITTASWDNWHTELLAHVQVVASGSGRSGWARLHRHNHDAVEPVDAALEQFASLGRHLVHFEK